MSRAAAEGFLGIAQQVLGEKEHFSVALSGGETPKALYQILAREFMERVPWDKVHLYWGDERYVPQRDPESNFGMFHVALLRYVHIPLSNIHPMPTHRADPDNAARDYEAFMRRQFPEAPWPAFDLIMLGMGEDGHTASLFPGSPQLSERKRWVVPTEAPVTPRQRLTFTLPVIRAAAHVCFLVAGEKKADTLAQVLSTPPNADRFPASAVSPPEGQLIWWVDEAAAANLEGEAVRGTRILRFPRSDGSQQSPPSVI
jgi:6-phosphogluconolactonase